MWTKQYEFKLDQLDITDDGKAHLETDTADYDDLCKSIVKSVQNALAKHIYRLLKHAPRHDRKATEFSYVTANGYHAVVAYYVSVATKTIFFTVFIVSEIEYALYQAKDKIKEKFGIDFSKASNSTMPDVLPAPKPPKDDDNDDES